MFADLYRVLREVGISPPVADEMELWEIASVLAPFPEEQKQSGRSTAQEFKSSSRDLLQQRLLHAKGLGPKPVPATTDASAAALMARV